MQDQLAEAVERAADSVFTAPPRVWQVPETADVQFSTGANPLDGMVISHWSVV